MMEVSAEDMFAGDDFMDDDGAEELRRCFHGRKGTIADSWVSVELERECE